MKRRIVSVALVAFALWPLVHRALVSYYDIDPWKLGGWAMFTAPSLTVGVALYQVREGGAEAIAASSLTPRMRRELQLFVARRSALGRLATPDDLGRVLFEERPDWQWAAVLADVRKLDRGTALIVRQTEKYLYEAGRRVELEQLAVAQHDEPQG
jgi:hypothetical protein